MRERRPVRVQSATPDQEASDGIRLRNSPLVSAALRMAPMTLLPSQSSGAPILGQVVGIVTGAMSGPSVLDNGVKHEAALEWWPANHPRLQATRTFSSRSGGLYPCFSFTAGVGLDAIAPELVRKCIETHLPPDRLGLGKVAEQSEWLWVKQTGSA